MAWVGKASLHIVDWCSTTQSISRYFIKPLPWSTSWTKLCRSKPTIRVGNLSWSLIQSDGSSVKNIHVLTWGNSPSAILFIIAHKHLLSGKWFACNTVRSPRSLQRCIPLCWHLCRQEFPDNQLIQCYQSVNNIEIILSQVMHCIFVKSLKLMWTNILTYIW